VSSEPDGEEDGSENPPGDVQHRVSRKADGETASPSGYAHGAERDSSLIQQTLDVWSAAGSRLSFH
jgi:hypothetical protein